MKILFAAAEGSPFVKTGGLADVIGALPKALAEQGLDVRVVLPKYKAIPELYKEAMQYVDNFSVPVGWREAYCGVFELMHEGVQFYFLDSEYYFGGRDGGIYGHYDDAERFAFFNRAVLRMLPVVGFQPDLIHSHDWHAGMLNPMLALQERQDPFYTSIRTLFTIHNLRYQGVFPPSILGELLGMGNDLLHPDKLEFKGGVSFMKGGINYADRVTTVSPTYANEIQTPYFGEGLDGALRWVGVRLSGILNGIDTKEYNPATDPYLPYKYRTSVVKKRMNKTELQKELGLQMSAKVPMIGMVTRLTEQKGLDLVTHIAEELLRQEEVQLVVLGSGDRLYEEHFYRLAEQFPSQLSVQIRFDEGLARRIYAASDLFLMPSQFEPCGLGQLLALRYGSIPIVRETGGLNDTVQAYNAFTGEGNGFSFSHYNAHDMLYTIRYALQLYQDPEHWKKIVANAFKGDYSWKASAAAYKALYSELVV